MIQTRSLVSLLLGAILAAGCTPNWRNIRSELIPAAPQPPVLRAKINARGWNMDWAATMAPEYHTANDPDLMGKLQNEVGRVLGKAGVFTIVDRPEEADVIVDTRVSITMYRPNGSFAWQILCGLLLTAPALIGAPIGWLTADTEATFELRARDGSLISRHVARDEQNHYIGYYYGHDNISEPYHDDLAAVMTSFSRFVRQETPRIVAAVRASGPYNGALARAPATGVAGVAPPSAVAGPGGCDLPAGGDRVEAFALVVGIPAYQTPGVPPLSYAASDACAIAALLADPAAGNIPARNIVVLLGADAGLARLSVEVANLFKKAARPGATGILYFSGHGVPVVRKAGVVDAAYLLPFDGDPSAIGETGYPLARLVQRLDGTKDGQIAVLLDACFSGRGRSVAQTGTRMILPAVLAAPKPKLRSASRGLYSAAQADEVANDDPARGHGLFTAHLLDGLRGAADLDGDGNITLEEVSRWTSPRVARESTALGHEQHPHMTGGGNTSLVAPGRRGR